MWHVEFKIVTMAATVINWNKYIGCADVDKTKEHYIYSLTLPMFAVSVRQSVCYAA